MTKKALIGLLVVMLGVVGWRGVALWETHYHISQFNPPMPTPADVLASAQVGVEDFPVRISYINTASQAMPRSVVLDSRIDPKPELSYVMSHPVFVLEWSDGRIFLVDAGLAEDVSVSFGKTSEMVGAEQLVFLGSVGTRLGERLMDVGGIGFTHQHTDHTSGAASICEPGLRIDLYHTSQQWSQTNSNTRESNKQLRVLQCFDHQSLQADESLIPVPGYPGLKIIYAAGHTPGGQMFAAHVAGSGGVRTWVMTGDVVNHGDGIRYNISKPPWYSWLLIPENLQQLDNVRQYLKVLDGQPSIDLLVSHDQLQIEESGIPAFKQR
jgi:glyoxylase-like metal-dependent hydrolase (beta-lactamase superfamily II)